jgi:hypothetical protein
MLAGRFIPGEESVLAEREHHVLAEYELVVASPALERLADKLLPLLLDTRRVLQAVMVITFTSS